MLRDLLTNKPASRLGDEGLLALALIRLLNPGVVAGRAIWGLIGAAKGADPSTATYNWADGSRK
jgi:hypothetical protein